MAYFDPGNYSTDLLAGSAYGYSLLFIVLTTGMAAILLQIMACRLGCVTGLDLAEWIRREITRKADEAMEAKPAVDNAGVWAKGGEKRVKWEPKAWRGLLFTLWVIFEFAIIATDLAELLGSAIAINL